MSAGAGRAPSPRPRRRTAAHRLTFRCNLPCVEKRQATRGAVKDFLGFAGIILRMRVQNSTRALRLVSFRLASYPRKRLIAHANWLAAKGQPEEGQTRDEALLSATLTSRTVRKR